MRTLSLVPLLLLWTTPALAMPAHAKEVTVDTDGISASGYAARELVRTAESSIGTTQADAMTRAAASNGEDAAADLGGTWAQQLGFDDTFGTVHQEDRIGTLQAGLAVVGFEAMGDAAKGAQQADFLLAAQDPDGGLPNGFEIHGRRLVPDEEPRTLAAQTAAIQGFLAAYDATKDEKYRSAARKSYLFIQRELWAPKAGVYRGREGARSTTYDPVLLGTTIGAFRELAEAHDGDVRTELVGRLDTLWTTVSAAGDPLQSVTFDTRK